MRAWTRQTTCSICWARNLRVRLIQLSVGGLLALAILLLLQLLATGTGGAFPRAGSAQARRLLETPQPSLATSDEGVAEKTVAAGWANSAAEMTAEVSQQRLLNRSYWSKVLRYFPNGGPNSPQYRLLEGRCSRENATTPADQGDQPRQHPIGFIDLPYIINFGVCPGKVAIVMAVHSAVDHEDRRRVIRQTWGSIRYVRGRRLLLVFFIGRPTDSRLQKNVDEEAAKHGDMVQRDFLDTYRNMTLKHLGLYDWLAEFCPSAEWLVKVDDDVFVDVFHLDSFLTSYKPVGLCCKLQDGRPERVPGDKWFVTKEEFAGNKYPKYCEGFAYIMQPTISQLLYWCSVFSHHLWIDDVYVLGILVQRLGLQPQQSIGGNLWADLLPSHTGRAIANNVFLVDRHNGLQSGTWKRLHRAAVLYSY